MFLLKKLISCFLLPLPITVILLLLGLYLLYFTSAQRRGKCCVLLATVLLLAISYRPLPDLLLHHLEARYPPVELAAGTMRPPVATLPPVKHVVVLAGGFVDDRAVPVSSRLGMGTLARLVEGILVYKKMPGSKLVVSGGRFGGNKVAVAVAMKEVALRLGVPAGDIVVEDRSPDTVSEAHYLRPLLGDAPFALVTSAAHMPRAMLLFRRAGMHPLAVPANFLVTGSPPLVMEAFFPTSTSLRNVKLAIHEYLGTLWADIALRGPYRPWLHRP